MNFSQIFLFELVVIIILIRKMFVIKVICNLDYINILYNLKNNLNI